jgi:FkbM family methyltransferase
MNGVIEILPNGQWIVEGDTHLGAWAKQHGNIITDPHLFKWLKPHVENARVVYDLGANIGDHTRQYLDWGMKVVAIEPNPTAFRCLEHNCPEAECFNIAASDHKGPLGFTQIDNVGASRITAGGDIEVPAYPLDGFFAYRADLLPGFVKIDVEGYEMFALRGMEKTLKMCKPIIFIEVNRGALEANGCTPEDITSFLRDYLGYTNFSYYPVEAEWGWPQFDLLCKP